MMMMAPLYRTPMDEKSGRAMGRYAKSVERVLDDITPWRKKASSRGAGLRGKVKPGEVVVVLDGSEQANDPLYAGAKITRE